jgi:isopenicillin N synthase-like dioxygenase
MLVQDDIGGLEVEDPNSPGTFVVKHVFHHQLFQFLIKPKACSSHSRFHRRKCRGFLDDVFVLDRVSVQTFFKIIFIGSNDTIRSTIHRVRSPTEKSDVIPSRYSIPYVRPFLLHIVFWHEIDNQCFPHLVLCSGMEHSLVNVAN